MNILKPEWFRRRKYSGWGLTPVTWQGWVFVIILVAPLILIAPNMANDSNIIGAPFIMFVAYISFIVSVVFYIMTKIEIDEREKSHEAISDRNALWTMLFVIIIGILAETVSPTIVHRSLSVNPFLVASILFAWLAKVGTTIYLDNTD
jgi:hypothetical protein